MGVLLLVGVCGSVLLLLGLLGGEVFDGALDAVGLDATGGLFSTEVIGGFLAALGFGGALLVAGGSSPPVAIGGGAIAGVGVGALAWRLTRSLMTMRTDPTPSSADLRGSLGRVITQIPTDGLGEVRVNRHGHPLKLAARAPQAIAPGTEVVVIEVLSATSVLVDAADIDQLEP